MFYVKLVPAILKLINCFAKKQYAFLQHSPLERRIIDNWMRELLVTQASKQARRCGFGKFWLTSGSFTKLESYLLLPLLFT